MLRYAWGLSRQAELHIKIPVILCLAAGSKRALEGTRVELWGESPLKMMLSTILLLPRVVDFLHGGDARIEREESTEHALPFLEADSFLLFTVQLSAIFLRI